MIGFFLLFTFCLDPLASKSAIWYTTVDVLVQLLAFSHGSTHRDLVCAVVCQPFPYLWRPSVSASSNQGDQVSQPYTQERPGSRSKTRKDTVVSAMIPSSTTETQDRPRPGGKRMSVVSAAIPTGRPSASDMNIRRPSVVSTNVISPGHDVSAVSHLSDSWGHQSPVCQPYSWRQTGASAIHTHSNSNNHSNKISISIAMITIAIAVAIVAVAIAVTIAKTTIAKAIAIAIAITIEAVATIAVAIVDVATTRAIAVEIVAVEIVAVEIVAVAIVAVAI